MTNRKKQPKSKTRKNSVTIIVSVIIASLIAFMVYSKFIVGTTKKNTTSGIGNMSSFDFKKEGELTFINSGDVFISKVDIEIAEDQDALSTGLKYRTSMEEHQAMLFIFPYERIQSFWMQHTIISLDMIFVNKDNEVVTVRKSTIPFDENSYTSTKLAIYVIEVNAGYTDRHNIQVGDKIVWRRL
ncbi:MAG: DUF192 domain-containing protein [Bacteroidetes bacterium]|nr:DUF192 domain-containing protein [Bacteroidota bacterium]